MQPEPALLPGGRAAAAAATAALRFGNAALGLVASIAISRALLPAGRGVYGVAATVAALVIVAGIFGVDRSLQHDWGRTAGSRRLAGAALAAGLGTGLAVTVAAAGAVWLWPWTVSPATAPLVWLALAGVPPGVATAHLTVLLALHGRPQAAAAAALISGGAQAALLVALALTGHVTPASVLAVGVVVMIVGLPLHVRALPTRPALRDAAALRLAPRLVRRGARYQPTVLLNHLLLRVDVLLVAALRGPAEAGLYTLAVSGAETILVATNAIAQAGMGAQARGDDGYTARLVRTSAAVALTLGAGMALVAPIAVPALFGRAFTGSVAPLLVILPGMVALAARLPLELAVSRRDRPGLAACIAAATLAVHLAAVALLVPPWGATGAAAASSAAYLIQFALTGCWFLRASGLPARALRPGVADLSGPLRGLLDGLRARVRREAA